MAKPSSSAQKGPRDRRIVVAAILAAFLVVFFVIVGLAQGIGNPSVSSDDVAVVEDAPDGDISVDQFQAALEQTALRQGIPKVPETSDPQYAAIRDAAMTDLLSARWVLGEAEERGITISDTEVTNEIDKLKKQYGGEQGFEQLLKQSGFTADEARERIQVQLLSNEIQKQVVGTGQPTVSQELIQQFYDVNKTQFTQPETRDVREIVNKDQAKVEQALSALQQDDSAASWKKVAAKYSTDKATSSNGGLRKGVAQGQSEPDLDEQIFSAPEGELIGPFKGQAGYYVIEVDKVNPASVKPLEKVQSQIKQGLSQGLQQEALTNSQTSITDKWVSRTFCSKGYVMELCDNVSPPTQTTPGAPPVTSSGAVEPGETAVFPGQAPAALPQGPQYPQAKQQPSVLGPGGAPQLPPGTVPPQSAPPAGG